MHAGRPPPAQPDLKFSSNTPILLVLSPLQRLRLAMCKQDIPYLASSLALIYSRDAIQQSTVSSATPKRKTSPIVFFQRWDTLLWFSHLADPADLTPIWTYFVAVGRDKFSTCPRQHLSLRHMLPALDGAVDITRRHQDGDRTPLFLLGI